MKHIFKQVKSAAVENLDQSSRDGLVRFEVKHGDNLRVALPAPHSQVVLRAADKSRTRDFLFLAHALTAVTVLFPCASPLKNGLRIGFLNHLFMAGAIAQDRESCQFVFCLMKNPMLYRAAARVERGREVRERFLVAPLARIQG